MVACTPDGGRLFAEAKDNLWHDFPEAPAMKQKSGHVELNMLLYRISS
jgi:hypothetical protein